MVNNYRPISIISNISKVLETILCKYIYNFVKSKISPSQHGFMSGRSTASNLAVLSQYVSEGLNSQCQVDVIYTDFSKAFDSIDHFLLLRKLRRIGFSNSLLTFFKSYLCNRTQLVEFQNVRSGKTTPTSGVPQGCNLGPPLFMIFINDVTTVLSSECLLFADDLKIFSRVSSVGDCMALQRNVDALLDWCNRNRLILNSEKCSVMSFSRSANVLTYDYKISKTKLARQCSVRDLGVLFDSKFTFSEHIDAITSAAFKNLGFIYRSCKDFTSSECLKSLYFAFVRSKLEYCSVIWYPIHKTHIGLIESIQRKFLKYLAFKEDGTYPPRGFSQDLLVKRFNLDHLECRRIVATVKLLHDLLNNHADCITLVSQLRLHTPRLNSRKSMFFYCSKPRTEYFKRSPIYVMCSNYNRFACECDIFFDSFKTISKCIISSRNSD